MNHSESSENVKKTQVAFRQHFITFSYFARTRPPVFYFGEPAVISYNKCYFVSIIQRSHSLTYKGGKLSFHTIFLFRTGVPQMRKLVYYAEH